jgi:hypothetical protein
MNASHTEFRIAWLPPLWPPTAEQGHKDGLHNNVGAVIAIHDRFAGRAATIASSRELTATGKSKQLLALGAEAEAELLKETAETYIGNIRQLEKEMQAAPREVTDRDERRHAEIRTYLLSLSAAERESAYRSAIADGDEELALAVDLAPKLLLNRLVHPKVREEMAEARRSARFPEQSQKLELFRMLRSSLLDAVQAARASLREVGILFPDDPMSRRVA